MESGGWGNSRGGCRLLQVFFCVLTCRVLSICVCVYVLVIVCFSDGMSHLTGTPRIAKETGRHIGGVKTRMWIKLPITHWALLEQIRTHAIHPTFEDEHETMAYCIMQTARKLGLETG